MGVNAVAGPLSLPAPALYASNATVVCADRVMSRILEAYYSPNINFETQRIRKAENYDVLRAFIEACQTELKAHALRKMTRNPPPGLMATDSAS